MAYALYTVATRWDTDGKTTTSNFVDALVAAVPGLSRGEDISDHDFIIEVEESADICIHCLTGNERSFGLRVGCDYENSIGPHGSSLSATIGATAESQTFMILKTATLYAIGTLGNWIVFGTLTPMRGGSAMPVYTGNGLRVPLGVDEEPASANLSTQSISTAEANALPPSYYFISEGIVSPGVNPYLASPYLINGNGFYRVVGASTIPAGVIMHNATDYFFVYASGYAFRI